MTSTRLCSSEGRSDEAATATLLRPPTSVGPDASLNVLCSQSGSLHVILFTPCGDVRPIKMVGIGYRLARVLRAFAKDCPKRK
jgi:hypothetical protein